MTPSAYCLGVDPAKEKATLCLIDSQGKVVIPAFDAPANREGFDLTSKRVSSVVSAEDNLLIGVEATAALDDNWLAFFPALKAHCNVSLLRLDPGQVKAFSGAKPVRAKTDNADARRIANFVRQYAGELARFEHNPVFDAMLTVLSERESTVADLTRLKNRLQDRLVVCFPEFASIIGNPYSQKALALLEEMPTAAVMARKHVATIAKIKGASKGAHRIGEELAIKLKEAAKTSIASQSTEVFEGVIRRLVKRIRFLSEQLAECNVLIDDFVASGKEDETDHGNSVVNKTDIGNTEVQASDAPTAQEDAEEHDTTPPHPSIVRQCVLLTSLPGVSNVIAATIVLRARGIPRFHSEKAFSAQNAAHPDRNQTGSTKDSAKLGKRGDRRSRPSLFLASLAATRDDEAFAFYKWLHESSGQTPKQAICSVMNRMTRLMWTLVHHNTPYDQSIAIANIKEQHGKKWDQFLAERKAKKARKKK